MTRKKPATTLPSWAPLRFAGKTFAYCGWNLLEPVPNLLEFEGARVVKDVTASLDYLVVVHGRPGRQHAAQKEANRLNQAGKASIQILDWQQFCALVAPDRDLALSLLGAGEGGIAYFSRIQALNQQVSLDFRGMDFRKAELPKAMLFGVNLDGADLREANLNHGSLGPASGVLLDGAHLRYAGIRPLTDCSARNADLTGAQLQGTVLQRMDLTGARLVQVMAWSLAADGSVFRDADLHQSALLNARLKGNDFSGANLSSCQLVDSDLSQANLSGANLQKTDLTRCNLSAANLTNADLREAILLDANLTNARLEGANFEGAVLFGLKLAGTQPDKAIGLDLSKIGTGTGAGANLRRLQQLSTQARALKTSACFDMPDGTTVELRFTSYNKGQWFMTYELTSKGPFITMARTLDAGMVSMCRKWHQGKLRLGSITVKAGKSPVSGKELKQLAIAAWCEASGLPVPSDEEIKEAEKKTRARQDELREQFLAELRGSRKGVAAWNKRTPDERLQAGHFHGVDLSGRNLHGALLDSMPSYPPRQGLDFQEANFEGAGLSGAKLHCSDFRQANFKKANLAKALGNLARFQEANFEGANLKDAQLSNSRFLRANFKGADLSGADFTYSDLCGADLSTANLTGAKLLQTKFDNRTLLPPGFVLPEGLIWVGTGPDPRTVAPAEPDGSSEVRDLPGLLERLPKKVDPARLKKALDMLKADRFRLFSQVEDNALVGVVKSQTDKNLVYSCRLASDGSYSCCTQHLNVCGGLKRALCKHLLVLIIGLVQSGQLDPGRIDRWVEASRRKRTTLDRDAASAIFLRYKGAEAGEVDWRPTETIPEDFYAF